MCCEGYVGMKHLLDEELHIGVVGHSIPLILFSETPLQVLSVRFATIFDHAPFADHVVTAEHLETNVSLLGAQFVQFKHLMATTIQLNVVAFSPQ